MEQIPGKGSGTSAGIIAEERRLPRTHSALSRYERSSPAACVDGAVFDALCRSEIFRELDESCLRDLEGAVRFREYARSELILQPGDSTESVIVVVAGSARLYRLSPAGNQITLDEVCEGTVFGLMHLDPSAERRDFLEAACEPTVVAHVPAEWFTRCITTHPHVALSALQVLTTRLGEARDQVEDLALRDIRSRLGRVLTRLASRDDRNIVWATHTELAGMVGTTRERVTKTLRDFHRERLVAYHTHRRGITVLEPGRLCADGSV